MDATFAAYYIVLLLVATISDRRQNVLDAGFAPPSAGAVAATAAATSSCFSMNANERMRFLLRTVKNWKLRTEQLLLLLFWEHYSKCQFVHQQGDNSCPKALDHTFDHLHWNILPITPSSSSFGCFGR